MTADRAYFEAGGAAAEQFTFPASCPERRISLYGDRIRIGRRSLSRAITPEIDLSCDPEDSAVSREHAQLIAQPDGSWSVVDKGSANGTYVNDHPEPIPRNLLVPLADGDVIRLGIWTMITLRRDL
ncbi:MAG: FHA domain-containing protein [Pseudonocardiaceae bacterium]